MTANNESGRQQDSTQTWTAGIEAARRAEQYDPDLRADGGRSTFTGTCVQESGPMVLDDGSEIVKIDDSEIPESVEISLGRRYRVSGLDAPTYVSVEDVQEVRR